MIVNIIEISWLRATDSPVKQIILKIQEESHSILRLFLTLHPHQHLCLSTLFVITNHSFKYNREKTDGRLQFRYLIEIGISCNNFIICIDPPKKRDREREKVMHDLVSMGISCLFLLHAFLPPSAWFRCKVIKSYEFNYCPDSRLISRLNLMMRDHLQSFCWSCTHLYSCCNRTKLMIQSILFFILESERLVNFVW